MSIRETMKLKFILIALLMASAASGREVLVEA
jgi:hypothetical protein